MTSKEAEHWLIERGFEYDKPKANEDGAWFLRSTYCVIFDSFLQNRPQEAIEFAKRQLGER